MQPVCGNSWSKVSGTAAGTSTLFARDGVFESIFIGTTTTGTVTFYDSESGTNAYPIFTTINTAGVAPVIHAQIKRGLTVTKGGTVDLLVTWL